MVIAWNKGKKISQKHKENISKGRKGIAKMFYLIGMLEVRKEINKQLKLKVK